MVSREQVTDALKTVRGPDLESNIVDLGMVSDIFISDGKVYFSLTVPAERAKELEPLRQAAERVVRQIDGVKGAMVALTADKKPGTGAPAARPAASHGHEGHGHSHAGHSHAGHSHGAQPARPQKAGVPGIGAIIAVASGKGGVGKSTTAVNLALGLKANGLKVGILDADIYGPSMPRLLKISGRPTQIDGKIIQPMENYGIKVMSMGFLVDEETAMIWRGPMVQSALLQMLREVAWGELDVLVVDMPPGTGDIQLTLAQKVPVAGSVIVTTPQDLALLDAKKGVEMFRKVNIPVLGVVENMAVHICSNCGHAEHLFGEGGGEKLAAQYGVELLASLPLSMAIRMQADGGKPTVIADPESQLAMIYQEMARCVGARIALSEKAAPDMPNISISDD